MWLRSGWLAERPQRGRGSKSHPTFLTDVFTITRTPEQCYFEFVTFEIGGINEYKDGFVIFDVMLDFKQKQLSIFLRGRHEDIAV